MPDKDQLLTPRVNKDLQEPSDHTLPDTETKSAAPSGGPGEKSDAQRSRKADPDVSSSDEP